MAIVKHSMDVVRKAAQHLNAGQTPVVTFDQPLYAIVKQIQWRWPEMYGEDKFVVMLGDLHIEMAALMTLGDGCKGMAGLKLWYKRRSQQQTLPTTSCMQHMLFAPDRPTK